jgi:hypothetical protein
MQMGKIGDRYAMLSWIFGDRFALQMKNNAMR